MATFAVIEFGFLFLALLLSYFQVRWLNSRRTKKSVQQDLLCMFNQEWNGTDEDEIYAWYRVRLKLVHVHPADKKLKVKHELISRYLGRVSSKPMCSRVYISKRGLLEGVKPTGDDINPGNTFY